VKPSYAAFLDSFVSADNTNWDKIILTNSVATTSDVLMTDRLLKLRELKYDSLYYMINSDHARYEPVDQNGLNAYAEMT
jgi:hypothetical protein